MIREFPAGLQGLASTRAVFAPEILLGTSRLSAFAHVIALAAAVGDTFAETLVAPCPLGFPIGESSPARLPPRLVAVFFGVLLGVPVVRIFGQLGKAGKHGIVMSDPVVTGGRRINCSHF